jgi:lipopolysaccharide transport system ATP-binding protein
MVQPMSDVAIRVDGLGKQYRIGGPPEQYSTLRDQVRKWTSLRGLLRRAARGEHRPRFWALKDVSFEVKRGEVVGIIGRNGAGKSTLLKILSRITEPTEGEAQIHGRVGSLLEVGTGFHQELTGRENVYLNGAILGMKRVKIARRFDEIVAFAEVEKFIDTPAKHYSSGMYMRLAFAVAAHLDPEVLVVDEVLAVGDAEFQKKCLGKMSEAGKSGTTVLFVSHNLAAVQQLCQRGALLQNGALVFYGDVAECVDRYATQVSGTGGRIIDHTTRRTDRVSVTRVQVNGSESDEVHLPADSRDLALELAGTAHRPIRGSLQVRLTDGQGTPIGIFSPGFERGGAETLPAGPFRLTHTLRLPRLNRGRYSLTFELVHPNVEALFEAQNAVQLFHEGTGMATGQTFDVAQQLGWLLLDEAPGAPDSWSHTRTS